MENTQKICRIFIIPLFAYSSTQQCMGEECHAFDVPLAEISEAQLLDLIELDTKFVNESSPEPLDTKLAALLKQCKTDGPWAKYHVRVKATMAITLRIEATDGPTLDWSIDLPVGQTLRGRPYNSPYVEAAPMARIAQTYRLFYLEY
jgi:hypothetical protein